MESQEQLHWLALSRLPACSSAIRRRLQAYSQNPEEILQAPDQAWVHAGASSALRSARRRCASNLNHPVWERARLDQDCLQAQGASLLALGKKDYPALLARISDPPPLLYVKGDGRYLSLPLLAMVGSRRASAAGKRNAMEFARLLAALGLGICSGLARGIDAAAHRGAISDAGKTVAVMATGIDKVYPAQHIGLAQEISQQGVLVTEFAPDTAPRRGFFPRRNRIISGLSLGVLVVEAAQRSGSLVTARLAMEQNREVLALPHSIQDPGGRGCHQLIRDGAALVESVDDVLAEIGSLYQAQRELNGDICSANDVDVGVPVHLQNLYERLSYSPVSVDDLVVEAGLEPAKVLAGVVELELLGLLESRGGLYMRK